MKLGVNTMVWTTQVGEKQNPLFARIKEWGFDGVEPFITPDEPANIPAVRATLDRLQLERTTCTVLPRDASLVSYDAATGRMAWLTSRSASTERRIWARTLFADPCTPPWDS